MELHQKTAGIVCQPGSAGATKRIYPRDVPGLVKKIGKTWCEKTRAKIEIAFADYMDSRLHFENVLVLWGDAGLAKSPAANATADSIVYGLRRSWGYAPHVEF